MADNPTLALASMLNPRRRDPFAQQRSYGGGLMQAGSSTAPVEHWTQGVARMLQGGLGGWLAGDADARQKAQDTKTAEAFANALGAKDQAGVADALKGSGLDPELMAPIFGQLLTGKYQRMQENEDAAKVIGATIGAGGGGAVPGAAPGGGAVPTQNRTATYESGNVPTAVNPQSRAAGLYQLLPGTAAEIRTKFPELGLPNDNAASWTVPQQEGAKVRLDQLNAARLSALGVPVSQASLYLAHRAGADGAAKILAANPNTPMANIVPPVWLEQNPDMRGTVGQFVGMAQQRFPAVASPPASAINAPQVAPPQAPPAGATGMPTPGAPVPQGDMINPVGDADVGPMPQQSPQAVPAPGAGAPTAPATPPGFDPGAEYERMARQLQAMGKGKEAVAYAMEAQKQRQAYAVRQQQEAEQQARAQAEYNRQKEMENTEWQRRQLLEGQDKEKAARKTRADSLAGDFKNIEAVKKYQWANTVFRSALEAADTDSAAGDLNLVYAFASLMDPGSVVREGEQGMVRATASASEQLKGMIESLNSGKSRLSMEAKQALIDQMGSRYAAYKETHDAYLGQFEGRARRDAIDPEDVVLRTPGVPWEKGQRLKGYSAGMAPNAAPPGVTSQDFAPPPAPPSGAPRRLRVDKDGNLIPVP